MDIGDVDEVVDNCVDGEAGRGVDVELGADVSAVRVDGVYR